MGRCNQVGGVELGDKVPNDTMMESYLVAPSCQIDLTSTQHTMRDGWMHGGHETLFHQVSVPYLGAVVSSVAMFTTYQ